MVLPAVSLWPVASFLATFITTCAHARQRMQFDMASVLAGAWQARIAGLALHRHASPTGQVSNHTACQATRGSVTQTHTALR